MIASARVYNTFARQPSNQQSASHSAFKLNPQPLLSRLWLSTAPVGLLYGVQQPQALLSLASPEPGTAAPFLPTKRSAEAYKETI